MVETSGTFEKVPISNGDIWEEYDPIVEGKEELGSGMCSKVTKGKLKGSGEDGEVFFIKTIHKEMIWTADNEMPALEIAGNYPGVVKCYKIFDTRPSEGENGVVHFVLKLIEGGFLEGWLQENHKQGNYLTMDQFFTWADKMLETVIFLHEKCHMIHSDLHQKNWLLTKDLDVICCDFGCAKLIGPGGKVPKGSKVFCADIHSGPEAQMEKGKSFFDAVTQDDISYANDTHQLGFLFKCMFAQGEWMIGRPVPNTYGKEVVEYCNWMMTPNQYERPTVSAARERLAELKKGWEARKEEAFQPDLSALFKGDLTPQHSKLNSFREAQPNFFTENRTLEETEMHDASKEMRVNGDPIPVDKDGFQGSYIGQLNLKGQFDGRGVLLQKRSLYEGYWKEGQKFGMGREIKLCYGSPFIKVIEGVYGAGGIQQGMFTEVHIAISEAQFAKCIVRTYDYKDGVIVEEKDAKVTYADGHTATGKLESMISVKQ